jgi:hypothetical protein
MKAWQIPYVIFDQTKTAQDLIVEIEKARKEKRSGAVLIGE